MNHELHLPARLANLGGWFAASMALVIGVPAAALALTANATAPAAHGLYNGIQTFRQLLPAWISSAKVAPGPWTTPVVTITDYPRYQYRGVLLDIARHYEPPSAVEQLIAQVAAYKVDVLHLHL